MAHYAFIDHTNTVVEVIVGRDENEGVDWEQHYSEIRGLKCLRTSYWTLSGINTRTKEKGFRGNYAGIGYYYNEKLDAFIPPKPSEDCLLNETTFSWDCPNN